MSFVSAFEHNLIQPTSSTPDATLHLPPFPDLPSPVLAVLPDVAVHVGSGDFEVAPVRDELDVAPALLRGKVDAEGELERGEELHAGLLKDREQFALRNRPSVIPPLSLLTLSGLRPWMVRHRRMVRVALRQRWMETDEGGVVLDARATEKIRLSGEPKADGMRLLS